MTNTTTLWILVIGLSAAPAMVFGVLRGRAVMKAFFGICNDLKDVGIDLPQPELRLMLSQLHRDPEAILEVDNSPGVRRIKERHVKVLTPHLKRLRTASRVQLLVSGAVVFLYYYISQTR